MSSRVLLLCCLLAAALLCSVRADSLPYFSSSDSSPNADGHPCTWKAPDGTKYDFSGLTTSSGTAVEGDQSDKYSINVCGIAQGDGAAGACVKEKASLCFQYSWSPDWYALAKFDNTPKYSLISEAAPTEGVKLTFSNGNYGPNQATTEYQFICAPRGTPTKYEPKHGSAYSWSVRIISPECCPSAGGSGEGGLSGGWVFVIIVLVSGAVYTLSGCLFKHYKQGTQGMESCPNIDFWRELPGLCKDGCKFFVAKVKGLMGGRGGAAAAGGNNADYSSFS